MSSISNKSIYGEKVVGNFSSIIPDNLKQKFKETRKDLDIHETMCPITFSYQISDHQNDLAQICSKKLFTKLITSNATIKKQKNQVVMLKNIETWLGLAAIISILAFKILLITGAAIAGLAVGILATTLLLSSLGIGIFALWKGSDILTTEKNQRYASALLSNKKFVDFVCDETKGKKIEKFEQLNKLWVKFSSEIELKHKLEESSLKKDIARMKIDQSTLESRQKVLREEKLYLHKMNLEKNYTGIYPSEQLDKDKLINTRIIAKLCKTLIHR